MSIRKYFQPAEKDCLDGRALNPSGPNAPTQISVARELNVLAEEESKKHTRQRVPEKQIKTNAGRHACNYGIPEALRWAAKTYDNYVFKGETFRDWRNKYRDNSEAPSMDESAASPVWGRIGRPPILSDDLTTEIR